MTHLDSAKAWLDQDPDPTTRAELDALITAAEDGDAVASADLADRFGTRLAFGTAGLRGELGAGSNRMNRVLVTQAAAGFARFLLGRESHPSVVIGYDGRINSDVFARDTAEIMAGAGVRAILLPRLLPTPVLAFAVRHLGVSAGVMVTASHNPPRDNGYKVYLGGADQGSQIVSPVDGEIHAAILDVANSTTIDLLPRSSHYETADNDIVEAYIAATAAIAGDASAPDATPRIPVPFTYTAMHGVGYETAAAVFARAGFAEPTVVIEQRDPDGAFPTVAFPNPEEPGAMDLAEATASAAGSQLIIAHDPDADRLAVAIPDAGSASGWRRLTGNEVGLLLGWRAAEREVARGGSGTLAASIVSSPALAAIADHFGLPYRDTLTGFKWVSRVENLAFGYEEALGYLVNSASIRDKDGISASTEFLTMAGELAAAGRTVADRLREADEVFGAFASGQVSVRVTELAAIGRIMARIRDARPASIGGIAVAQVDDFANGFGDFGPSDILRFWLDGGSRVIVRPSGTEPKVKVYIDAVATDGTAEQRRAAALATVAALEAGARELLAE